MESRALGKEGGEWFCDCCYNALVLKSVTMDEGGVKDVRVKDVQNYVTSFMVDPIIIDNLFIYHLV